MTGQHNYILSAPCVDCGTQRKIQYRPDDTTRRSGRCRACASRLGNLTRTTSSNDKPSKAPAGGFADLRAERYLLTCREYGDVIAHYEDVLEHAGGKAGRRAKREAHVDAQEICRGCPLAVACRKAAHVEMYTGLAGGLAWKGGAVVKA